MPQVVAARPDVRLVVAGDFWGHYLTYARRVVELRLGHHVILHDHYIPNEQVPVYFAAADVVVAPYRRATGSGVVQTAAGLGKPVIGTEVVVPTPEEAAAWYGRIVPPCDPSALAAAIVDFLQSPPLPPPARAAGGSWHDLTAALMRAAQPVKGER
jgi:glycosyltransferase involved in cell wall biosynthesis